MGLVARPVIEGANRLRRSSCSVKRRLTMSRLRGCKKSELDVTFSRGPPHLLPMPPGIPVLGT